MAFQAFMDESGSGEKDSPVFMLCGYVSPYYWWEDFSDEWQAQVLDGPPKLEYFKMREAVNLSDEFARVGVKIADRDKRVAKAISLIKLVAHASLSCAVPFRLYNRIAKGKVPKDFDNPAFLAYFDVMTKAVENQLSSRATEPVDFIFDDHVKWRVSVPIWYNYWKHLAHRDYGAMMGETPLFRDDRKFLPLQAADLQSWYFRRLFAERFRGETFPSKLPKDFFQILDGIPTLLSVWDEVRLQNLATAQIQLANDGWPRKYATIHDLLKQMADIESS